MSWGSERTALERGTHWLKVNLPQFSLSHASSTETRLRLMKPLGELTLTLDVLKACGLSPDFAEDTLA